ncbi:MAG: hypothetical protein GY710_16295 [Desulfobacteraceae bacterium]|nr:hypothetical protein [Desulfobacteraceae bacterium]
MNGVLPRPWGTLPFKSAANLTFFPCLCLGELIFLEMENEPHYKIAKRLGLAQRTINNHLADLAVLPNPPNADFSWIMIQKYAHMEKTVLACTKSKKVSQVLFLKWDWKYNTYIPC